uniref:Calponin-homology (CH) domain-containing protein n=1 Tax=Cynoglossus semilaevis TaxID=244447 RepID=A0A3P8ULN1_CYNSE
MTQFQSIESRLKVVLPEDLGSSLMDGVVLCHLANHIKPRSVASIHVPSPAVPKLSMAKCRRNVENFLDACRRIGIAESSLCSSYDIIQCRLRPLRLTVQALIFLDSKKEEATVSANSAPSPKSKVSVTTQTPSPTWQIWDLICSSLVHVLCLALLFVAYTWSELL